MKIVKTVILVFAAITVMACNNDDDNTPQNQAPVVEDKTISVSENLTSDLLTTIAATDVEGDTLIYSIVSQSPSDSVLINELTGEVFVNNASVFDYDVNQVITVVISVSDGENVSTSTLIINITEYIAG
ncbi:MAG: cadherin repeat domain-containing protein [Flavobacteriaceae bacterium]